MKSPHQRSPVQKDDSLKENSRMPGKQPPPFQLAAAGETAAPVSGQVASRDNLLAAAGPPIPAGSQFVDWVETMEPLEITARQAGYGLNQTISALRKIYYGPPNIGGLQAWDAIIPRAANNDFPDVWNTVQADRVRALSQMKDISISGQMVDMGHVLAGLDARQHPSPTTAAVGTLGSNLEAATWVGDLGAVIGEYYNTIRPTNPDPSSLMSDTFYNNYIGDFTNTFTREFGPADIHSDLDAYAINIHPNLTLKQNLYNYYHVTQQGQGQTRRYTRFAQRCGLFDENLQVRWGEINRLKSKLVESVKMYYVIQIARGRYGELNGDLHDFRFRGENPEPMGQDDNTTKYLIENLVVMAINVFMNKIKNGIESER